MCPLMMRSSKIDATATIGLELTKKIKILANVIFVIHSHLSFASSNILTGFLSESKVMYIEKD